MGRYQADVKKREGAGFLGWLGCPVGFQPKGNRKRKYILNFSKPFANSNFFDANSNSNVE
jgi:hypothetical protein